MKTYLNADFFEHPTLVATRVGFGTGLLSAGKTHSHIVALCSDLTESTQMHLFADAFPQRFIEIGVAEQNLVTVASGMAAMGKLPVCSSYATFSPGRNWEQIRTTICYNNRKVIIVGSHSGISVGPDGGTHQALEDIALMRVLPNMSVVVPCDSIESEKATLYITSDVHIQPTYLRLTREKTPVMTDQHTEFVLGKAYCLTKTENIHTAQKVKPIAIVGCGPVLSEAVLAAHTVFLQQGIETEVWNFHTVKPLDTDTLDEISNRCSAIITLEEHQRAGGLGSAVCEYICSTHSLPVYIMGISDRYGQSGTMPKITTNNQLPSF